MRSALIGVSGARRNACAAVCVDGEIRAACEQERLTRVRGVGLRTRPFPSEAVDQVLTLAECRRYHVSSYVVAERAVRLPAELPSVEIDHHLAHAATAYLTSPFDRAAVIVCDSNAAREVSVWTADGSGLRDCRWPWRGRGFARLYSDCAALFTPGGNGSTESRLEALAHLGCGTAAGRLQRTLTYRDGSLRTEAKWRSRVHDLIQSESRGDYAHPVHAAAAVQRRIGEVLVEFVAEVAKVVECDALCVGGGLFYNTYFTTLIRRSGLFDRVFVPINPGNAGVSVGATLMLSSRDGASPRTSGISPFLGPAFDDEAIKLTLDGCKLSYSYVTDSEALDATVDALTRGELVGWFDGRMEWGHKALGHRSILADPFSPYVLDNLNGFLRKRERWRPFGVSTCADDVPDLFCGPPSSSFMEYEYGVLDDRLRHVMPTGAASLRVQTVTPSLGRFHALHKRMKQATGTGALVNTSLNAFHEPIACTPRDAIGVFYGTGLDMLVMGRFILRK